MPNKDLINILGEPENKVEDLRSVLGEPELKKKAQSSPIPTDISSSESGAPSSQEPKPFVESTGFVPQSTPNQEIKSKQSQIIQERTKQQFLTNPLFQEANPNAQKNKEVYINTLANKGYNRSDLELEAKAIDRTKELAKEKGILDMSESELSKEFWNKTIEATKHGYQRVKEGFEEMAKPLIPQEYKTAKDFVDKPLAQEPNIKPYLKTTTGLLETAMSPIVAGFDIGTKAIKEAADKTLPEPAAKVVGNAIPALFNIVSKASKALGVKVEYDVDGTTFSEDRLAQRAKELNIPLEEYLQKVGAKMKETPATYLMEIGNMVVGGKYLHLAGEGSGKIMEVAGDKINNIESLKNALMKASKGELSPEDLSKVETISKELENSSLADIKKGAENHNSELGDVVSAKITDIEQPSAEHKVNPELEQLHKDHQDLINAEVSPELQPFKEKAIADSQAKIDEHLQLDADQTLEQARQASELNHINESIRLIDENKAKNIDNPAFTKLLDEQLKPLQERKTEIESANPEALKEGEIKTEENAIKEIKQPESVQGEREGRNQIGAETVSSGGNRLLGETPSTEEKIKTIPELTDEEYIDKFVNSGLFNPVGDVYQERLDLGMPTADIQKGLRDIELGKDSAPARKLKEAILKTKETQTVPVIRGTGGKSERFNRDLSDYSHDIENAPVKLTAEEIKSANKINPILAEAISKEGITVENIDKLIDENAGEFPYSNEDLQTIKDYLNEKRRQETAGNVETETVTTPSESVEAITESKRATEKYNEINSIKSERIKSKAKEKFVEDNFENIVAQLMLKNKLKRKC